MPLVNIISDQPGFKVSGRFLYDHTGKKVILYGVNKMVYWTDIEGFFSFKEIAKTGSNCVRIQWLTEGLAKDLDNAIYNCIVNGMIPIPELHDATGDWSRLQMMVDYWIRPDILEVIKKYSNYLLINIANECGQDVKDSEFRAGYEKAVKYMRSAGIKVPIIIDTTCWGKDAGSINRNAGYLIDSDPQHNLMFSLHMWWSLNDGYSEKTVEETITEFVKLNIPVIIGEFGHKWDDTPGGAIPYLKILEQCHINEVGYLPWEWGPGNIPQTFLDMTRDGTFDTLEGWGLEVCITNPHSIKKIAKRPSWIIGAFKQEITEGMISGFKLIKDSIQI